MIMLQRRLIVSLGARAARFAEAECSELSAMRLDVVANRRGRDAARARQSRHKGFTRS